MKKQLRKAIENLGWLIHEYADSIDIEQCSPAGEDFFFTVGTKNTANDIREYALNFDADEHAEMWVENRGTHGIPQRVRTLIEDADAIQQMLDDLAIAVATVA